MITTKAICTKIEYSDSNNVSFVFFSPIEKFEFKEWQFMFITIPNRTRENGKALKNAYSIWTTNKLLQETWEIWFIVKKASEDWVSHYLTKEVKLWDEVEMSGPLWHFFDKKLASRYFFITIWSWVTPVYAIFEKLLRETGDYSRIINIFGERYKEDVLPSIYELFQDHNERITNYCCFSREEKLPQWWSSWYVQDYLEQGLAKVTNPHDTHFFICGKPVMCNEISAILIDKGFTKEQMTIEKY